MRRFPEFSQDGYNPTPITEMNARSLYETLLDEAWSNLAPAIQRAHPRGLPIERIG